MTLTVTPTGTKPIPQKTEAKLSDARGYLCEMEMQSESADKFRRLVANFLTAANSVTDVLINEIAAGDRIVKRRIKDPIEGAMDADGEMGSLIRNRNRHMHEGDFELTHNWIPVAIRDAPEEGAW